MTKTQPTKESEITIPQSQSTYGPLRTLPRLLRTNQGDDARQLGTLVELLLLHAVGHILAGGDFVADGQHAVLERKQLAERVVEEGGGEGDVGGGWA
jgi:hypothetical protein